MLLPELGGMTVNVTPLHIVTISEAITGFGLIITSAAFVLITEHPPVMAGKVTMQ